MIRPIYPLRATMLAALLCGASSVSLLAQGPGGGGPEHHPHHGPPPSPLFDALDTNHDGVLSGDEIANAPASLKALLKGGASELKREDLRPTPPRPGPDVDSAAGENDHPRPRVPLIRPHGPPLQTASEQADADAAPAPDAVQPNPQADGPEHRHHPAPEDAARPDEREGGPEHHPHHGPPPSPLFDALDTNHDGVISAEEMNNAAASVKGMLKPGSSELRREDLRPEHQERPAHHPED